MLIIHALQQYLCFIKVRTIYLLEQCSVFYGYAYHIRTIAVLYMTNFQIIFAFIPPPGLAGGWLCFFCSLGMIGLLTAIVGDLAGIFGCLVGLRDSVTGSNPDTCTASDQCSLIASSPTLIVHPSD